MLGKAFWVVSPLSLFWYQGVCFVCAPFNWSSVVNGTSWTSLSWFLGHPKSCRTSCGGSTPTTFFKESLEVQRPYLLFWSDASDHGWGSNLQDQFISGRWLIEERSLSINLRELRAIRLGLHHFRHSLRGLTVGVSHNTMALSYVKKRGRIPLLSTGRSNSSGGWNREI